ncbi:periplasmic heavy metal sensor [Aquabacter sp. CN5-332]|uniref:periplasmic heavy metal sensor n=1 Tax=Aquabacter sp. CN5-332 TaxID=3156608 RepID=UPI0032B351C0
MSRRPRLWIAILTLLCFSVALNLFLAGYALHTVREGGTVRALIDTVASVYPSDVRQEFRAVLRENRGRSVVALQELRNARAMLAAAVNAPSYDETAIQRAMQSVRTATGNVQATMQDYLLVALKRVKDRPSN